MAGDMAPQTQAAPTATAVEEPVLVFDRVSLSFGPQRVLDEVSFQLQRGDTKILLGEAGAGKSVLLKLALGLLRPSSGRVLVLGQEVGTLSEDALFEMRRRIGIAFQESALFDSLSVRDNVGFRMLEEGSESDDAIEATVRKVLSFVELEAAIEKMPVELSGGMQHRVSIARALATQPEIMLYDSPTGGLDPVTATTIVELIMKLRDQNKVTSLLVTHRLQDGFLLATHVWEDGHLAPAPPEATHTSFLLLRDRKIFFDGSAHDLQHHPDPYVRSFLD